MDERFLIREALRALEVEQLVFGIHDASFPGADDEDVGRGSPYSAGAEALFAFIAEQGFTGVQLGPQGITHVGSPSPYEGTLFSRNPHDLPIRRLAEAGLVGRELVERLVSRRPDGARERMPYGYVFRAFEELTQAVVTAADAHGRLDEIDVHRLPPWIVTDAAYDVFSRRHGVGWWRDWPEVDRADPQLRLEHLRAELRHDIRGFAFIQQLLSDAHRTLRERVLRPLELTLYGDLQVGFSARDMWAYQSLFLADYRMGAPPSRTNPDGQPWGYEVLDPQQYGTREHPGASLAFVRERVHKVLDDFDGVRVDHPHGWVDPWVYRSSLPDPLYAVQNGARLFSSPNVAGHPRLAGWAIAREDQLDHGRPRYADDWVLSLDPAQVDRYAMLIDVIVEEVQAQGRDRRMLVCEVLSTLPFPVRKVMERHGLGRFRVMQKAKLDDRTDVYRTENAEPEDWIMLGNHDTPPIWTVVDRWAEAGELQRRADDVAARLSPGVGPGASTAREQLARSLGADRGLLVNALLADALASRARNVFVFFADFFGMRELYNAPGTVSESNWTLRAPPDFRRTWSDRAAQLRALHIPTALAMALRARGGPRNAELASRVEAAFSSR